MGEEEREHAWAVSYSDGLGERAEPSCAWANERAERASRVRVERRGRRCENDEGIVQLLRLEETSVWPSVSFKKLSRRLTIILLKPGLLSLLRSLPILTLELSLLFLQPDLVAGSKDSKNSVSLHLVHFGPVADPAERWEWKEARGRSADARCTTAEQRGDSLPSEATIVGPSLS